MKYLRCTSSDFVRSDKNEHVVKLNTSGGRRSLQRLIRTEPKVLFGGSTRVNSFCR